MEGRAGQSREGKGREGKGEVLGVIICVCVSTYVCMCICIYFTQNRKKLQLPLVPCANAVKKRADFL